ncbi:hypothetical protein GCM10022198_21730 [Klugiella xanthotipulae]|uniref:ATP synthase protein I n=1 Tax=Klugiella xanthotipulae TaxID=244735 RepID=A0A543HY33_9MICO|nr:hypothetical protein [Klugiella xanthotipulae]TQM63258.1 hypothetical protein FB466_1515 [Klugiella xanthotipulae]
MTDTPASSTQQSVFRTMLIGVLLYSVVLGFFNDYTDTLVTSSYSITFSMAIVMQALTAATFAVKVRVARTFRRSEHPWSTVGLIFGVWLVLFLSKFVFLAVLDVMFRDQVQISGFVGIFLIVAALTVAHRLVDLVDGWLGSRGNSHHEPAPAA